MRQLTLRPFWLITFGITWGIVALLLIFPDPMTEWFGELSSRHPLFMLAVYAPAIAAFVLVLRYGGIPALGRFLSRLLLWRVHWGWYAFLLLGIPVLFYGGAAIKGNLWTEPFPFDSLSEALSALAFMFFLGSIEEFGWRGYAQPLLQRRFAPIWAGTIIGLVWGLWHLPAFALGGTPQSEWSFLPFFIASVAISIIMTALFNASRGSILLAFLMHWQLINPVFPDAAPYDTITFGLAAIAVAFIYRRELFSREGAVSEVVPPG